MRSPEAPTLKLFTIRMLLPKSSPVVVVGGETPLDTLEELFLDARVPAIVVVDEQGVLGGTISRSDVRLAQRADSACAVTYMSTRNVAVLPEDDVDTTAALMTSEGVDFVLVVAASGELLGIVSARDLDLGLAA